VRADDPAAEHHHACRRHPGHPPDQDAAPAIEALQRLPRRLDGEAARHLAHRRKQRQVPARVGHRLVGDGADARFDQPLRLSRIGGKVQIGEQDLPRPEPFPLLLLRLLHLDDHLGCREHLRGARDDLCARPAVDFVAGVDAVAGACLHQHFMAGGYVFAHCAGRKSDAVFLRLDFLRDPDPHSSLLARVSVAGTRRPAPSVTRSGSTYIGTAVE
jgi:hypothetical protein